MAYQHTPYLDASSFPLYTELPMDRVMDPEIQRSVSPASTIDSWNVHRYLTDKNKSPFLVYPTMDSILPGIVAPFPPTHFQRPGSPSCTNSSSTCSSVLSPPRETDYCQIESWGSHPQVYEFTGLADGCVNPGDVNPIQDSPVNYYGDGLQQFNLPMRTCSMSSDDSCMSHVWQSFFPDSPMVKEEIHIQDDMEVYHPIEEHEIGSADEPQSPYLKSEPNDDGEEEEEEEEDHGDHDDDDNNDDNDDNDDKEYSPRVKSTNRLTSLSYYTKSHKRRSSSQSCSDAKRPKITMEESLVVRTDTKSSMPGTKGQYPCPGCLKVAFKDQTGLDNHIKKQHTRPFTCLFDFAGCKSTFASKNEWKRHCQSQHIVLQYWVCQQDACAQVSNRPNAPKRPSCAARRRASYDPQPTTEHSSPLPNGTIFNRKDLYTQHLRRMHVPAHLKKQIKLKKSVPEWDERQRLHQSEAIRTRCQLPTHMLCPAPNCNVRFDGGNAWDERMEHVAKHLEKAAAGTEPPVQFGGVHDATLVEWATSPAIGILKRGDNGGFVLQNPLKATGYQGAAASPTIKEEEEDEEEDGYADAEGEEVDE